MDSEVAALVDAARTDVPASLGHVDVAIVGAGFAGLLMAALVKQRGRESFVVLERASDVGGTWRDNRYPGSGCDVPSHLYSYADFPEPGWSRVYARQPEILEYLHRFVDARGIGDDILYDAEVVAARWEESDGRWAVELHDGRRLYARVLVPAWGQLSRPSFANVPGREDFDGPLLHTARWRGVDLRNQRVACAGSGASAIQVVPPIAAQALKISIFQRSPNYIVPRNDRAYTEAELRDFANSPDALGLDRDRLYEEKEAAFARHRLGSAVAEEFRQVALDHLANQVRDPVLRRRLTPAYPVGCKRILISDDFYPALKQPHVTLVDTAVERVVTRGVQTVDGAVHEADVIVFATGFETESFLGVADVTGHDGRSLRAQWQGGASAYLGICVPHMPNLFMLYGPNTNLGHNSVIAMIEVQAGYVLQALDTLAKCGGGDVAMSVRTDVAQEFDDRLQRELARSSWAGDCGSWYKNAAGRIVNNWSGTVEDYRAAVGALDPEDFVFSSADRLTMATR